MSAPTHWIETDDPRDPCWLCVSVEWDDEDPMNVSKWHVLRPRNGELVAADRIYREQHPRCAEMVEAYQQEHKDDHT